MGQRRLSGTRLFLPRTMALGLALFSGIAVCAQTSGQSGPPSNTAENASNHPATPTTPQNAAGKEPDPQTSEASNAKVDPRQAQLMADTQKLLKLSQELKAEVAKTNKDTLSIAVIKKAEEVEKLAKSIKEEIGKNP
jgi:hypothetical protein